MGKIRRGGRERRFSNETTIKVVGAPSIIPVSFTAVARADQTWYDFLADNGLKLTPSDGLHIRSSNNYYVSAGCRVPGLSGELNEKIGTFMDKFTYKNRKLYSVRLMRNIPPVPVVNFERPPQQFIPPVGSGEGRQTRSGTSGAGGSVVPRKVKLGSRQYQGRRAAGEEEAGESGQLEMVRRYKLERDEVAISGEEESEDMSPQQDLEEDDFDDDNMSVMTSASQEATDLRRNGIPDEDLKNSVRRRVEGFGNGLLLRAREEIRKLKGKNLWIRNYQRAPLACFLVEEMLKP